MKRLHPLIPLALFLACVSTWVSADLWYDEVLSLELFILPRDTPWAILRDYRIANNHILANFLEWLWLNLAGMPLGSPWLTRLPALACGLATIATVQSRRWREALGDTAATAVALLLAVGPVFPAFACQMRGYAPMMLLAALLATAALARRRGPSAANAAALFACSLLLPLCMPSAAMAPCAAAAGLAAEALAEPPLLRRWREAIRRAWPALAGACLGVGHYLTLGDQLRRASIDAGGWESAWTVAAHLLLAALLHLGAIGIAAALALRHKPADADAAAMRRHALWQLGGCLLAVVAILLLPSATGRAPFPRVFLALLPALTLNTALLARQLPWIGRLTPVRALLLIALPAAAILAATTLLTQRQLRNPATPPPQNLLQQYYRGNNDATLIFEALPRPLDDRFLLVAEPYLAPSLAFYWNLYRPPTLHANRILDAAHLTPEKSPPFAMLLAHDGFRIYLVTRVGEAPDGMLRQIGLPDAATVQCDVPGLAFHTLHEVRPTP